MASINVTQHGTYRVSWREPTGRQRSKVFKLRREARAFKAQIENDLSRKTYIDPHAGQRVQFRDHAARWLAGRTVEVATAARDESLLRVHVLPRWGDWPLARIDHMSVQEWIAKLGGQLAPATVRECQRVFALILASAVQARAAGPESMRGHPASAASAAGRARAHAGPGRGCRQAASRDPGAVQGAGGDRGLHRSSLG
jgi:hypothetical protein